MLLLRKSSLASPPSLRKSSPPSTGGLRSSTSMVSSLIMGFVSNRFNFSVIYIVSKWCPVSSKTPSDGTVTRQRKAVAASNEISRLVLLLRPGSLK